MFDYFLSGSQYGPFKHKTLSGWGRGPKVPPWGHTPPGVGRVPKVPPPSPVLGSYPPPPTWGGEGFLGDPRGGRSQGRGPPRRGTPVEPFSPDVLSKYPPQTLEGLGLRLLLAKICLVKKKIYA